MIERLQKLITQAGVASRRKAGKTITEDRVAVSGRIVTKLGTKVELSANIEADGLPVQKENKHTYLLYKPRGVISSAGDDKGREIVLNFFEESSYRLCPVGGLDYDTSGLLLITSDDELANKLMYPRHMVSKVYVAKIKGLLTPEEIYSLKYGVRIDGKRSVPAKVRVISTNREEGTSIVRLTIHEGHYHQVKRIFKAVGHLVDKLSRGRYAFLTLKSLTASRYRELTREKVAKLKSMQYTKAEFNRKAFSRQGENPDRLFESATHLCGRTLGY